MTTTSVRTTFSNAPVTVRTGWLFALIATLIYSTNAPLAPGDPVRPGANDIGGCPLVDWGGALWGDVAVNQCGAAARRTAPL